MRKNISPYASFILLVALIFQPQTSCADWGMAGDTLGNMGVGVVSNDSQTPAADLPELNVRSEATAIRPANSKALHEALTRTLATIHRLKIRASFSITPSAKESPTENSMGMDSIVTTLEALSSASRVK